ncbi:TetR family transcriptional regulator [Promicromonospora sp. Populi]|uniref:TetR family transcriptional regulator n=1 Tax=Promicromonospora sp. Populi TaxID=3239420 RepID=UPI0034E2B1BB
MSADVGRAPTPERILEAAAEEFAQYGLAGARVDRIAEGAAANKQRIYAYFGGKESLFDQVVGARILDLLDAVPFDADDLPGYAVRLFDFTIGHPELIRLLLWHTLERPGMLGALERSATSSAAKVVALRDAQARHPERLDATVPPDRLLGQVLATVHGSILMVGGMLAVPEGTALVDDVRADVHRAVTRVIAPASDG